MMEDYSQHLTVPLRIHTELTLEDIINADKIEVIIHRNCCRDHHRGRVDQIPTAQRIDTLEGTITRRDQQIRELHQALQVAQRDVEVLRANLRSTRATEP